MLHLHMCSWSRRFACQLYIPPRLCAHPGGLWLCGTVRRLLGRAVHVRGYVAVVPQSDLYLGSISPAFQAVQQLWTLDSLPSLIWLIAWHVWHMLPELEALTRDASAFQAEEIV